MPLVTGTELLADARRQRYAIGAFNANNLEYVQGIVAGAEREEAPVIIQASPGAIKYAGLDMIAVMVSSVATRARVPVVLHLDHGDDVDLVAQCIRRGFTSVMFDGSRLGFADNVRLTAQVARMARRAGVTVEGELGVIPGSDDQRMRAQLESLMTDPEQAERFVGETGVHALAVSVGSIHQLRDGESRLDVDRITHISRRTGVPLVLHGSSGVNRADVRRGVEAGLAKVNVATALHQAFTGAVRSAMRSMPSEVDARRLLEPGKTAVAAVVADWIVLLNGNGRAKSVDRAVGGEEGL